MHRNVNQIKPEVLFKDIENYFKICANLAHKLSINTVDEYQLLIIIYFTNS